MGRDRRPPAHPEWGRHLRRESRRTDVAVGRQPSYHAGAAVEILVRPGHAQAQGDRLDQGKIRRSSGAPMTDYREADVSRLKTVPIAQRPNKVDPSLLAHPPGDDPSFTAFWDSLPDILAAKDLRTVARQLVQATGRRGVVAMLGGHVIKVGLGPLLRELIRRGVITHLALNGSAAIHDGGVVLNVGSAVVMPEVFLKALTVARNLGDGKPTGFTACDCDMQRHYRPRVNVVERPTLVDGRGIQLTGHHEILIPLLAWAVLRELDAR